MNNKQIMKSQRGVTLMELMIVVAIISIIAAVAYPSYTQFVTRSKRSVALVCGKCWMARTTSRA